MVLTFKSDIVKNSISYIDFLYHAMLT